MISAHHEHLSVRSPLGRYYLGVIWVGFKLNCFSQIFNLGIFKCLCVNSYLSILLQWGFLRMFYLLLNPFMVSFIYLQVFRNFIFFSVLSMMAKFEILLKSGRLNVDWESCRIHRLQLCRGVRLPNVCPGYDTKQSDGEAPLMLDLWGMRSTRS